MILEILTNGDVLEALCRDESESFDPRQLGIDEDEQDITEMDLPGDEPEHHTTEFFAGMQSRKKLRGMTWPSR